MDYNSLSRNWQLNLGSDTAVKILETRNEKYKIQMAVKKWLEDIAMEKIPFINEKKKNKYKNNF